MKRKLNPIIILGLIIITCLGIIIINILKTKSTDNFDISIDNDIIFFKDRHVYRSDNKIFLGNNVKEIENGYFDIEISVRNNNLNFFINKLFKEKSENIYDEEYLNELIAYINSKFDSKLSVYKLKSEIQNMYLKLRKSLDKVEDRIVYFESNLFVKIEICNYQLKLEVGDVKNYEEN